MGFRIILFFACATTAVWAYSGGAPETVCSDMTPKHPVDPQSSQMPYEVTVDKSKVKIGDKVKITIGGNKAFKGFLLQVRDGENSVGTFQIDGSDRYAKTINCHNGKNNAATHKNSADKENLSLIWSPPRQKKTYTVFATVAENGGVYWVRQPTAQIQVV